MAVVQDSNKAPWRRRVGMPDASRSLATALISRYPLISDQVNKDELLVILSELTSRLRRYPSTQSVVEFGCYIGTTSLFIRRVLDEVESSASFHVYDSFEGLPEKMYKDSSPTGEQFKAGELAVSRKRFEQQFKKADLRLPIIHKNWFSKLESKDVPGGIGFAYLDGDYYQSIWDSLELIWPNLTEGAIVVIDDYMNEALPGTARAVNEWLITHSARLRAEQSLAILYPNF